MHRQVEPRPSAARRPVSVAVSVPVSVSGSVAVSVAVVAGLAVGLTACSSGDPLDAAAEAANAAAFVAVEAARDPVQLGRTELDNSPVPSGYEGRVLHPLPPGPADEQVLAAVHATALDVTGRTSDGDWLATGAGTTMRLSFTDDAPGTIVTYRVTIDEDEDAPVRASEPAEPPSGPQLAEDVVSAVAVDDDGTAGASQDVDEIRDRLVVLVLPSVEALGPNPLWVVGGVRAAEVELTLPVPHSATRVLTAAPADSGGEPVEGLAGVAVSVAEVPAGAETVTFQAEFDGLYWLE